MKPLQQEQFTLKLVKDLGMRPIGGNRSDTGVPRKARFCTLECNCGVAFDTRCDIGKRAKSCKLCSARNAGHTHGDSHSRLYKIWQGMKKRCASNPYYADINVINVWCTYTPFRDWSLKNGYKEKLELDRIDTTGDYTPENCRWTTRQVQGRNTRRIFAHNTSGYRGVCPVTHNQTNPWKAYIKVNNCPINLGYHSSALLAAKAYDTYVITHNLEHTINGVLHEPLPTFRDSQD